MRSRTLTGAQTKMYVNGRPYGRVAAIDWVVETPSADIQGIDTLQPTEAAPEAAHGTAELTVYRLHRDGGLQGAGMGAYWPDLAKLKYFSVLVVDRLTDTVLFRADRCTATSERWGVRTSGHVSGTVHLKFVVDWTNDSAPGAP